MGKSRKILNLIALTVFMGSNLLTPISYAVDDLYTGSETDSSMETQDNESGENVVGERGNGESEAIYSGGGEKNPQIAEQFLDLPISGVAKETPINVQNDEGETQNDEQNTDLADMSKMGADENTPIDMLTLELEKSEQPQVQDVSTVIDYYPDSNVRYTLNGNENFTAGTITITDGTDTITILDRNLGATAAGTGCHYKTNGETYCSYDDTYGYHFQWGNNHGFKPGCDLSGSTNSCSDSITSNAVSGQVDATTISYNPANQEYYNSGVFYKGSRNWLNDSNKVNLWGGSTGDSTTFVELTEEQAKLRQGPCPKGFHVPSVGELVKLSSMMTGSSDSEKDVQLHNLLYIPYAGFRNLIDAYVYDMGYYTYLWSSSPSSSNNNISWNYNILDPSLINYYISRGSRADAYSIRCFYDKYETYEVPEVDTTPPAKPEIGCPDYDEVLQCVSHNGFCPQYDFDDDGVVDDYDIALLVDGICTSDNSFINENKDLTNNENPKLMRKTPGGVEWVEEIGGYEIQICSDSGCNNVIHSGSHEDVVGHTDLSDGMYYRRVKAIDIAGNEGEWSDIWLFTVHTTPPAKPEIRCPSEDEVTRGMMFENTPQYDFDGDGQLTVTDVDIYVQGVCTTDNAYINEDKDITNSKNPRLVWTIPGEDGVDWIEGYEIQICGDSSCNNVVYSGTYEEMIQNELSDGKYYWRVKAVDIFGSRGEWSNIWSFTVDTVIPSKPEMGVPTTGEIYNCILDDQYCPQYDFDKNGRVTTADLNMFQSGVLLSDNTFIKENEDITNSKNPRFVRSTSGGVEGGSEIGGYEIQICSDSGCNTVIHSGSYEEVVGHTDLDDGKYYWRVKAIDKVGNEGERSDILSFTVDTIAPSKPEIRCPSEDELFDSMMFENTPQYDFNGDGTVDIDDLDISLDGVCTTDNRYINEDQDITKNKNPRLVWTIPGEEGAIQVSGYEIQICRDSGCNNVIHSGSYEDVVGHTNLDDGIYYWRVKAIDKAGNEGEWSNIFSFTVDTIAPSKPEMGVPTTGEIYNCILDDQYCPQYDFDKNGRVTTADLNMFQSGVLLSDNTFIKENEDITNSKNPRLVRKTPGGSEGGSEIGGYEIQICRDSGCNNVIHSGSYEDVVGYTNLDDGIYYWRVKAIDKAWNEGEWSDIFSFTVDQPKYTVSYVDGVSGSVFVPQITTGLLSGQVTPDFNGSTGRVNYIFVGWNPIVNPVVTGDVTYTAQWYKDFNGNGENDETEDHFILTIHYVNSKGATVYPDYTGSYVSGASYSVVSTAKEHYTLDKATVSGVMGNENFTEIVTYSTQTPDTNDNGIADEDETHFTLEFTGGENGTLSGQTIWPDVLTGLTFDEAGITIPEIIPNSGYMFSGWDPEITGGTVITSGITLTPVYGDDKNGNGENDEGEEHFTLEFTGGENGTLSGQTIWPDVLTGITFGEAGIIIPEITPNSGYIFGGWSPKTPTSGDVVSKNYSVIWKVDANNNGIADEDEPKSSGSSGGGGGGGGKISNDSEKSAEGQKGNKEDSSADKPDSEGQEILRHSNNYPTELDSSFTKEQKEAYEFAKKNGITTMPTIQKADMSGRLTRIQMAKMLSQYAINVLGKTPDKSKTIKFKDVTPKNDADYDNGVTLAYQLGIMGQNMKNNKFRPDDEVTRAEFATALSRLLFNTSDGEYKSTSSYYVPHIKKLMQKGIITKDDPKMKERRGYVMIMLLRSVK